MIRVGSVNQLGSLGLLHYYRFELMWEHYIKLFTLPRDVRNMVALSITITPGSLRSFHLNDFKSALSENRSWGHSISRSPFRDSPKDDQVRTYFTKIFNIKHFLTYFDFNMSGQRGRIETLQRLLSGNELTMLQRQPTNAKKENSIIVKETATGQQWTVSSSPSTGAKDTKPVSFRLLPGSQKNDSLTVIDNRTNEIYEIPITDNTIPATAFKKMSIKGVGRMEDESINGLRVYDPGFQNTAVARSKICYINGDEGILHYRGYPIEELAESSNFLEVAYLLIFGELPTASQYANFSHEVMHHTFLHVKLDQIMQQFNYDAHPMGMFISGISAMSTFHPEANPALAGDSIYTKPGEVMNKQIFRLLGKAPTIAAYAYRTRIGRPVNMPQNNLSYTENFLYMLDHLSEKNYIPNKALAKALDVLFILHADHELNCSTAAMRHIGSSRVDPYSAISGAASALYGPLHGGANEAVLRMLERIGSPDAVPAFIEEVKARKTKLFGFGHRIYKNYDPRAKIVRRTAYEVFDIVGREPLVEVAIALEKAALSDEYFKQRKLYPNVDYWSGLIYKAMGFPTDMFPVLFAIPRVAGWLAHWKEQCLEDKDGKIWRPRQVYVGEGRRSYVPMSYRSDSTTPGENPLGAKMHPFQKRSSVADYDGNEPIKAKI